MRWRSVLSRRGSLDSCFEECLTVLEDSSEPPDFLAVFVAPEFDRGASRLLERLKALCPRATLLGCSARGLIGDGVEAEFVAGLCLTAGWLPGVEIREFHLEREAMPDLDSPPEVWRESLLGDNSGLQGVLLVAEPFSFPGSDFLAGVDYAYPDVPKAGGLASGGQSPESSVLLCRQGVRRSGVLGVGFFGDIQMRAVVAQGCRPIGKPMVVTECSYNEIATLDGQLAGDAVLATLRSLPKRDQQLAAQMLFVGIGAGGPKLRYEAGDFLIRQVLGVDPQAHSLVVNGRLRKGQTVQLHVRDHRSSAEDLESMLDAYQVSHWDDEVTGALLFSCVGRGRALYGHCHHDSEMFKAKVGDVPVGGFFGNGEFGPVGGTTSLHGFTSCFAVFCEPPERK